MDRSLHSSTKVWMMQGDISGEAVPGFPLIQLLFHLVVLDHRVWLFKLCTEQGSHRKTSFTE